MSALFASVSFAAGNETAKTTYSDERWVLGMASGVISGHTQERVYEPEEGGRKLSQLNWRYDNAAVIKGTVDWHVLPWMSIGAQGWTTISRTDGHMVDYDWQEPSQSRWTDRSVHPDTTMTYANEFDLNLKGWIINESSYRLGLVAGYQERRFSFNAKGGSYDYDNGGDTGVLPAGAKVIGYKQRFKTPYVGVSGSYSYKKFELDGTFKYSRWASAEDNDEHYLAKKSFVGETRRQRHYSLVGSLGYRVADNTKIYLDGTWSHTRNKKGRLTVYDHLEDDISTSRDTAGIEHANVMMTVGLKQLF